MSLKNLFFHIHYCNSKLPNDGKKLRSKITRTLQHHELLLVTGGKGSFTLDRKKHPVQDALLFYIRPGVPHTIEIDEAEPICFYSVHFSYASVGFDDGAWSIGHDPGRMPLQAVQLLQNGYQVEDAFRKLVAGWYAKLPGYELLTRACLQQMLYEVFQNLKKQNQNHAVSLKVEKVIQHMHDHLGERITLAELSELVHLSSYYLSRAFKQATGYTVIEYFNKLKIDKAKELILEGDRKIREVALELGFADEFYFSRIFKRTEGISPSEFYSKIVHGV
ncbi:AraC family transcriptional regulator [Paenibacillus macerans]|uniref:helix-turn-helix transcriptional regulator n=1 Tax=Paenibacillus macerans TaxID=44252 RepID=UPI003D317461